MKIKTKILVWYGLSFLILIAVYMLITLFTASTFIQRNATTTIKHETEEIAQELTIEDDGRVYYKDDDEDETFRYLYDNIIYVIYKDDVIFSGEIPGSIQNDLALQAYEVQTYESNQSTWLIYDVPVDQTYTLRAFYSTSESSNIFNQVLLWMLIFSPIFVLVSLSGGYVIIKQAFKPIHTMTKTALEITHEQHYDTRIAIQDNKDEVTLLASTINQMLDSIEKAIEREQSFTTNVSHELRTPLSVLRAQIEYLKSKNNDHALFKDFDDILKQLSVLENLVSQLLEWVRTKHIQVVSFEDMDAVLVLQTLIESFEPQASQKHIQIDYVHDIDNLTIQTELASFVRIFTNLISNAVKYTEPNGHIVLTMKQGKQSLIVEVKDNGIGMSQASIDKAFDPFFRADPSREQQDSLGIGLSITKNLVERLNGTIIIKSQLKQGTTIVVTLPIAQ